MIIKSTILACAIASMPHAVVDALISNESQWKPWTISVNYPKKNKHIAQYVYKEWESGKLKNKTDALVLAKTARTLNPKITLSVGLMQISMSNFKKYDLNLEKALDPCTNVNVGSKIYMSYYWDVYDRTKNKMKATLEAASLYNSGNNNIGWSNGYVKRFVAKLPPDVIESMPSSKFDTITQNNRADYKQSLNTIFNADSNIETPAAQNNKNKSETPVISATKDNSVAAHETLINMNETEQAQADSDTLIPLENIYQQSEAQSKK